MGAVSPRCGDKPGVASRGLSLSPRGMGNGAAGPARAGPALMGKELECSCSELLLTLVSSVRPHEGDKSLQEW